MFERYTDLQTVADMFKGLVYRLDIKPARRKAMLESVSRFERQTWRGWLMDELLPEVEPAQLFVDEEGKLHVDGKGEIAPPAVVHYLLEKYIEKVAGEMVLMQSTEAAAYLGMTPSGLKYHLYRADNWRPSRKVGRNYVYTLDDLFEFDSGRRKAGRPKGVETE